MASHPWPGEKPNVPIPAHKGWLGQATEELLSSVLSPTTRLVVELGSWLGLSTRFIADRAPGATIVAIDHWQGSPEHRQKVEFRDLLPVLYETFLASCWDYRKRIVPLRATTLEGLEELAGFNLRPDVVYLDADHRYEAVWADLEAIGRLFPDAVLVGDDWNWEGVHNAVVAAANRRGGKIAVHGTAWRLLSAY